MRRSKRLKRVLFVMLALVVIVPLSAVLYFFYLFDWNHTRAPLSEAASAHAGRQIVINGDIRPHWGWPLSSVRIDSITVANMAQGSAPHMLELRSLAATIDWRTLLKGDLEFTHLDLEQPRLLLEKDAEGGANWDFLENPAGATAVALLPDERDEFPIIDRLDVRDGRVTYRDRKAGTDIALRAATVAGEADQSARRIHVAGKGVLQGQPFSFKVDGASVLDLRDTHRPYPLAGSLIAGATSAHFAGTVTDPIAMRGLHLRLRVAGHNAADLFPLTGIALLPTPPYEVTGKLGYEDGVWLFNDFAGHMGDSDLSGDLRWDTRPQRPMLEASFTSRQLDLEDLSGFIGGQPDAGTVASNGPQPEADDADPRLLPDVPLDISRLAAMDAKVQFQGLHVLTRQIPIDDFHADFLLDDRLLKVNPVRFGSGKGDVAMWLTINAREQPVHITNKLEVRRIPLADMLDPAAERLHEPKLTRGYIGGTADLAGTGRSLRDMFGSSHGNVGLGMEGGQLSQLLIEMIGLDVAESAGFLLSGDKPVSIRCVVADFKVDNGLMEPRALVLDTEDTLVTGEGKIDLKDEALDLKLKPAPKDFSPLALRVPLVVRGTLKHPEFGVSKGALLARGAAAVALAVVFPPAIILAVIEPGLGKDSQCQVMLSDMAKRSKDPEVNEKLVPNNPKPAGAS